MKYRVTCEKSLGQIKENIAGSIQYTSNVQNVYTGIVDQIDVWVDKKLVVKSTPNDTLKDIEFTPTNYVEM